jgi:hypothetical protein
LPRGDKCPCIFDYNFNQAGFCPDVDKCGIIHEQKHCDEGNCDPKCPKPILMNAAKDPKSAQALECKHRKEELNCLMKLSYTDDLCKHILEFVMKYTKMSLANCPK